MSNIFERQKTWYSHPYFFSNVFPGYRGLQYIQYFFVFPVISYFFTCKKSKFSRPGLQINSHANVTYSSPQLNIILIPTMIRSIRFSFITLIAGTGSPHSRQTTVKWHLYTIILEQRLLQWWLKLHGFGLYPQSWIWKRKTRKQTAEMKL